MTSGSTQTFDGGKMRVADDFVPVVERLGLTSLKRVKTFEGDLIKKHRDGRRDIFRIVTTDSNGQPLVLFLKRIWRAYKKDGIASVLRRGKVWSISRQEWENSRALEQAGLRVGGLIAYGEDCAPLWEKFSFIITKSAPGITLEEFLQNDSSLTVRRRVFDALALEIQKMHRAGLATPDLFTRHVFVAMKRVEPVFCLIDMARVDRCKRLSPRRRARDLAALNATAPLRFVSARERLRFLRVYASRRNKKLARLIEKRMTHLLKRSKFKDFSAA